MNGSPRYIALKILHKIDFDGGFSNISLSHEIRNSSFSELDKGFLTELVYGVIERKITLDYFISRFSTVPVRKMNHHVLLILRISAYQMAFMDKVPFYSICDEAVKLAKKLIPVNAGFINAVLRSMSQTKLIIPSFSKKLFHSETRYLSVKYSLPEWLIERWIGGFGHDFALELFNAFNHNVKFEIRVNRIKSSVTDVQATLGEKGYRLRPSKISCDSLIVENPSGIIATEEFKHGLFYVQDSAASLVSIVLDPGNGERVFDACSAPGGKATHIAEIMGDTGEVIACDVFPHKIDLISENATRLGLKSVHPKLCDSLVYNEDMKEKFDRVLLDVPCTGLGLLARKPEIRWSRNDSDFEDVSKLQMNLLNNCSKYLKPNGCMVYSTCSIDHAENEDVINAFVDAHSDFEFCSFEDLLPDSLKDRGGAGGMLTLYPHLDKCDGFFIAKIRRKAL